MSLATCPSTYHRHQMTCARCSVTDQTVAVTTTRDGNVWPPLCSQCASRVHRQTKGAILAALEAHEARQ